MNTFVLCMLEAATFTGFNYNKTKCIALCKSYPKKLPEICFPESERYVGNM